MKYRMAWRSWLDRCRRRFRPERKISDRSNRALRKTEDRNKAFRRRDRRARRLW